MEFLTKLGPIDLFIIVTLAGGILAGFTQGLVRYVLNALVVLIAFVIASQLHVPLFEALGFWEMFSPALREQVIFLVTFVALVVGGWFIVRAIYRRTSLPVARQLDELGGAIAGLLFAVLSIVFMLLVMDSFFKTVSDAEAAGAGPLKGFYDGISSSVLVDLFRQWVIPTFGALVRPLVPPDIARLLLP